MLPSPVLAGREHDETSYFVVPPTFGAYAPFSSPPAAAGLTADVSVPAPALSFAPSCVPGPFQPGEALSVGWAGVLRRHPCGVP